MALARLRDLNATHLALPSVETWKDRAAEQIRWLCLVIARTFAPDAIVIGGTLHEDLIQGFIEVLEAGHPLGEDFLVAPPRILRASQDHLPQLGAAALPIHDIMNPEAYRGQARKGW